MPSPRSLLSGFLPRTWCLLALALGIASPASAQAPGTWAPIADLNQPRAEHTATLLANGTVLIAGGRDAADQPLASAEIYDPATGAYTLLASPLPAPVWGHTATRLDDGTVLIAGGQRGVRYRRAAQLFDPASDTFAALTPMSTPRGRHTATLLRDGRVLLVGGTDGVEPLASLEIYDPTKRTFSPAPSALAVARQDHTATLLPDGRVLVAGGSDFSGALESAELYDPTAGTVSPAAPLNVPRTLASAALLLDGTVLVAGGQTTTSEDLDSAELYDAATHALARLAALMGEGWRPNEQVTINIRESSGDPDTNLTATADASGAFTNSEFQTNPDRSDVGVRFLATATGQASNWTAQTTFTDPPRNYTASITPTTDTAGHSLSSYTITITNDTTSGASDVIGSVNITIPAGYSNVVVSTVTAPRTWTAVIVSGVIQLRAASNTDRLSRTESVSVALTATSPCTAGSYVWSTTA